MDLKEHIIKINLPGGIVSPGDLHEILSISEKCNVEHVRFGNRQQLLFKVNVADLEEIQERFLVHDIAYETDNDVFPNILSSYVTEEIFPNSLWLTEGVYKDILDGFNHQPKLKVNVVDYYQNLIPFFTGNLNFIASETSNFWYFYIRFPKTNIMYCWPSLVYSEDIPEMSKIAEQYICEEPEKYHNQAEINGEGLFQKISSVNKFHYQPITQPLIHTDFQLPYYEGLNKYSDNKLWLGIYRRKEEYSVSFLKEICEICLATRIGQLYTTAWKSIIIKNINSKDRDFWSDLLNKYRINVRHAANELNWQIEDLCEEAINIKLDLVKQFEEADLRTYRLCFAIKTQPKTGLFSSIVIRKRNSKNDKGEELFELLHTRDFNPNSKEYITFEKGIVYEKLGNKLIEICDLYYTLRNHKTVSIPQHEIVKKSIEEQHSYQVHQCKHCETIYDEQFGDEMSHIPAGISFSAIEKYSCPTCDAPKQDFEAITIAKPIFI